MKSYVTINGMLKKKTLVFAISPSMKQGTAKIKYILKLLGQHFLLKYNIWT